MTTEAEMRGSLRFSVAEWHAAALDGADVPVRFKVVGSSMRPLIRRDRDAVTIVPLRRAPNVGDITLFDRESRGDYVLRRVFRVRGDRVQTFGDGWLYRAARGETPSAFLADDGRVTLFADRNWMFGDPERDLAPCARRWNVRARNGISSCFTPRAWR